jgi:hypothetical protein
MNTNGSLTSTPDGIPPRNLNGIEIMLDTEERNPSDASFVYLSDIDSFEDIEMYKYLIISIHYKFSIAVFLP